MLSKPISGGIEESIFGKEPESTFTITDFLNAEIDASVPERMEAYLATTESEKKRFPTMLEELASANRNGANGIQEANAFLAAGEFTHNNDSTFYFTPGEGRIQSGKDYVVIDLNVRSAPDGPATPLDERTETSGTIQVDWQNNKIEANTISRGEMDGEIVAVEREVATLDADDQIIRIDDTFALYDSERKEFDSPDLSVEIYMEDGRIVEIEQPGLTFSAERVRAEIRDAEGKADYALVELPKGATIHDLSTEDILESFIPKQEEINNDVPSISEALYRSASYATGVMDDIAASSARIAGNIFEGVERGGLNGGAAIQNAVAKLEESELSDAMGRNLSYASVAEDHEAMRAAFLAGDLFERAEKGELVNNDALEAVIQQFESEAVQGGRDTADLEFSGFDDFDLDL